jgi:hypothetical protein
LQLFRRIARQETHRKSAVAWAQLRILRRWNGFIAAREQHSGCAPPESRHCHLARSSHRSLMFQRISVEFSA